MKSKPNDTTVVDPIPTPTGQDPIRQTKEHHIVQAFTTWHRNTKTATQWRELVGKLSIEKLDELYTNRDAREKYLASHLK